ETRNTITEPINLASLSLGVPLALIQLGRMPREGDGLLLASHAKPDAAANPGQARARPLNVSLVLGPGSGTERPAMAMVSLPKPGGGGLGSSAPVGPEAVSPGRPAASQAQAGDWLDLTPRSDPQATETGISTPWHPASRVSGGAVLPPRGGSGTGAGSQ